MPHLKDKNIEFTRAFYLRRTKRGELGGRMWRLVYNPEIYALVEKGKYVGLEEFKYGISGEFAINRALANKIVFDSGYKIETSLNMQVYHELHGNMNRVAQCDLGIFEHFSSEVKENKETGRDRAMENMAREITEVWVEKALESGLELSEDEFFEIYMENVDKSIENAKNLVETSELAKKFGIKYGEEQIKMDKKRLRRYAPFVKEGISNAINSAGENPAIPSWRSVKEICGIKTYEDFKEHISSATTLYTLKLLEESELI